MRRGWLLGGAVAVVAGLLLAYFPLAVQETSPQSIPSATSEYVIIYQAPLDLLFPRVAFHISWQSTEVGTNLSVLSCGGDAGCTHPGANPVAQGHGQFGNLSFLGRANEYYTIIPENGAVEVTVTYTTPLLGAALGFGLLLGGVAAVAVGFTGRRRPPLEEGDEEYVDAEEETGPSRDR